MNKHADFILVLSAIAVTISGCPATTGGSGGAEDTTAGGTRPAARQAVSGGVLRLPLEIAIDDPAVQDWDLSDQRLWALARATELPLIKTSPTGELLPGLASGWQTDASSEVWTLELQTEGLDAGADGIATVLINHWRSVLRGDASPLQAQLADLVAGAAAYRDGQALDLTGVAKREGGLEVQLTRPYREFPVWLSQPGLGLAGYGPFLADTEGYEEENKNVLVLKPNPQWPGGRPLFDELRFICEPDRGEQLRLFRAGELDAANVPDRQVYAVLSDAALADAVMQHETAEMLLGIFNYSRFPWDDGQFQSRVGLRQAMNWGLDREMLAEVHGAQFKPWPHFLPALWQDYIDPVRLSAPLYPLTPRIEQARSGMKEADHEQGIRLPQGMDLAYLPAENTGSLALDILDYWREISIRMGPFGEPLQVLLERVISGGHEVVIKRVRPAYPAPDALIYGQLHSSLSGAGGNWTRLEDPAIDGQIEAIQAEQDPVSRRIALRKLGNELEDRALSVFIGYSTPTILINPELAGYELGPYDFDASLPAQDFAALGWAADSPD